MAKLTPYAMITRTHQRSDRRGYVLGIALVVMLVFLITCIGFMNLTYTDAIETTRKSHDLQTFWASESANNLAIRHLELLPDYRTTPTNLTGRIGEIDYATEVKKNDHHYTIRTTARRGTWKRVVEFQAETTPLSWHPAFYTYAALVENGTITTAANASITGSVHDNDVGGSIPGPMMDTSYYDKLLSKAATSGAAEASSYLTLDDSTLFIRGDQSIQSILGSGMLIVSDDIEIQANATIGPNVTMLAGDRIDIQSGVSFGTNTTLYAGNLLSSMDNCHFSGASSLISALNISIADHCTVFGSMYAAQSITISSNTTIQGSAFAVSSFAMGAHSTLQHAPNQFADFVPPILEGSAEHISTRHQWSEPSIVATTPPDAEEEDD